MARSAAMPPKLAPYPTDVGTATTGTETRPPTTLANAPSIPATTMITEAFAELLGVPEETVDSSDADIIESFNIVAEHLRGYAGLFGDRDI